MRATRSATAKRPVVATRSAFDALAVESASDSSEDEQQASPPVSPRPPPSTAPSVSTKKGRAKQRARDRANKAAIAQSARAPTTDDDVPPTAPQHQVTAPSSGSAAQAGGKRGGSPDPEGARIVVPDDVMESEGSRPDQPPVASGVAQGSGNNLLAPATQEHDGATPLTSATVSTKTSAVVSEDESGDEAETASQTRPAAAPPGNVGDARLAGTLDELRAGLERRETPKPTEARETPAPNYGTDHQAGKKLQSVITRVIWSLVMVFGFIGLMLLGHVYLIVLVFLLQVAVFREVTNLFEVGYKASAKEHVRKDGTARSITRREKRLLEVENDRWSKVMSWYFFVAVNYFLYGESIIYYFKHIVFVDAYFLPFARHHRFISLLLYLAGFLTFVANLDRDHLRRQFALFSWIHMSLLLIVVSSHFMVNNVLEGLIWFWVPASCVIMNDVAAYVFGMLFGRHQLIKLSPKKTVEGFVGGYFATVIFAYAWGTTFQKFNYMICPVRDLGVTAFSSMECVPNSAFVWHSVQLPEALASPLTSLLQRPITQLWWTPFQLHTMVLGTFAGLVAPFGGFFASGFKRAFGIKDFGDTIPGHGGLTDRFDCQFIMGLFAYFYYSSLVRENHITVDSIVELVLSSLSVEDQVELIKALKTALASQGIQL